MGNIIQSAVGEKLETPNFVNKMTVALLRKCAKAVGKILPERNARRANAAPQKN